MQAADSRPPATSQGQPPTPTRPAAEPPLRSAPELARVHSCRTAALDSDREGECAVAVAADHRLPVQLRLTPPRLQERSPWRPQPTSLR